MRCGLPSSRPLFFLSSTVWLQLRVMVAEEAVVVVVGEPGDK